MPVYKPPTRKKYNDWRDAKESSSEDELPDPKDVIAKIGINNKNNKNNVNQEDNENDDDDDPSHKLSIVKGDQTTYDYHNDVTDK